MTSHSLNHGASILKTALFAFLVLTGWTIGAGAMATDEPSVLVVPDHVAEEGPQLAPARPASAVDVAATEVAPHVVHAAPEVVSEGAYEVVAPEVIAPEVVGDPAFVETCHPIDVIRAKTTRSARRAYRCYGEPIERMICVRNPADCDGCLYAVPVCVPACCDDEPECVGARVGLLGRGYAVYCWPCGFEVEVIFRKHGGALLVYR